MSDAEIHDELLTLLVAGHETTATALSWAVERLIRHPDKLARLRAEVEAGEDAYLTATIQETLRLRPVVSIVIRRLTEAIELGGYQLPAGVSVVPAHPPGPPRSGDLSRTGLLPARALPRRRPAPTPGSPSAVACAVASAPPLLSRRWRWCCASWSPGGRSSPTDPAPERNFRRAITETPRRNAEVVPLQLNGR